MVRFLLTLFFFTPLFMVAQQPYEATLLYNWDDTTIVGSNGHNNAYNEVWGIVANGREYAVIGSTEGTHFIDVTDEANSFPLPQAFVPGGVQGPSVVHRDYHDYRCHLYAVCQQGGGLQVIDYSTLPDSVSVTSYFNSLSSVHNIFIDTATSKLYSCDSYGVTVFEIDDSFEPIQIASYGTSSFAHDIYVRNDTGYINTSQHGLMIVDFDYPTGPLPIGSFYSFGYNHSGWLSDDGQYYYLAEESVGFDISVLDVSDLTDIQLVNSISAYNPDTTPIAHNLMLRGDYLYVSYYTEGLQVFDVSDPLNITHETYYDTYPFKDVAYAGAWGVFSWLPSGNILISDMQKGLHLFQGIDPTITGSLPSSSYMNCQSPYATAIETPQSNSSSQAYPQPFQTAFTVEVNTPIPGSARIQLLDIRGRIVQDFGTYQAHAGYQSIPLESYPNLPSGLYLLRIESPTQTFVHKMIKQD